MAENIYDRHGTSSEDSEAGERTRQVQIREEEINEERKTRLLCEVCVGERPSVSEHLSRRERQSEVERWFRRERQSEVERWFRRERQSEVEHWFRRERRSEVERWFRRERQSEVEHWFRRERQSEVERWYEERVAVYLCFDCVMYVCRNCLAARHRSHRGMKVGRKEREMEGEASGSDRMEVQSSSERMNKGLGKKPKRMRLEENERDKERRKSESERMEEENERKIRLLLDDLMKESKTERMEKFENSQVGIYDRVNVKHKLDRMDCWITGLCVLENTRWVACDYINHCIKIFSLGSNLLQRYIRIVGVGYGPWDVTEILVNQNSTEPNLESGSRSEVSVTARAEQNKQCLVSVTLPGKRQIVFIDLSQKPALLYKVIRTEKECWAIKFYDGKIFTVCGENRRDSRWSVYIKSTDGVTINKFDTVSYGYFSAPYLAVVSGRVYLTDTYNSKVQCRNVEGQLINEITIEGSRPEGISVDPDNNVYVCAWGHNELYKLDADLTRYKSVLDRTAGSIAIPDALCYYKDQLFISHFGPLSLLNHVTVVGLL